MSSSHFFARSLARVLLQMFFLAPRTRGRALLKGIEPTPPFPLFVGDLTHPVDLLVLYGYLPISPRPVLRGEAAEGRILGWIEEQVDTIRVREGIVDEDARQLIGHSLRETGPVFFPLSAYGDATPAREAAADLAAEMASASKARLVVAATHGTAGLPPAGPWLFRYRPLTLSVAAPLEPPTSGKAILDALATLTG